MKVWPDLAYDPEVVRRVLGVDPLPTEPESRRIPSPWITVDGRVNTPTSDFLRRHCAARPNQTTARRIASDLAAWLDFLINERGRLTFDDARDPILAADEDDFAAYYRLRQYSDEPRVLTSQAWGKAASAIKRLYEYCQVTYLHPPPFHIVSFTTTSGVRGTTIAKYRPRRRDTGSAGVPLTPSWAELLLAGALRVDLEGQQDLYRGADRDHAIISLALGTGLRRHNLANITTYEVPPLARGPFTTMRVADRITKGDAGGDALVFSHRLGAVHEYITGARADAVTAASSHLPEGPLHISTANAAKVTYTGPDGVERTRRWVDLDASERRRLVNPDGTTPLLFVNEYTGAPLTYSALQHAVAGARSFVIDRIEPDFPPNLRLHDLRHTYAVHLAVSIYRGVLSEAVDAARASDWAVDHVAAAVELVKTSLGHASESSTKLYVQTAYRFLTIPREQFVGEF